MTGGSVRLLWMRVGAGCRLAGTGCLPRILISHNDPPPIRSHPQAPSSLTAPIHGLIVPQHPGHYLILLTLSPPLPPHQQWGGSIPT